MAGDPDRRIMKGSPGCAGRGRRSRRHAPGDEPASPSCERECSMPLSNTVLAAALLGLPLLDEPIVPPQVTEVKELVSSDDALDVRSIVRTGSTPAVGSSGSSASSRASFASGASETPGDDEPGGFCAHALRVTVDRRARARTIQFLMEICGKQQYKVYRFEFVVARARHEHPRIRHQNRTASSGCSPSRSPGPMTRVRRSPSNGWNCASTGARRRRPTPGPGRTPRWRSA